MDCGNTKIPQHALKASVFRVLRLDTVGKKKMKRVPVSLHKYLNRLRLLFCLVFT